MDSIWEHGADLMSGIQLMGDHDTDILIIGAGMAGILTAHFLSAKGIDCAVIDSGPVAGGITSNTTAKITSQHGPIYSRLTRSAGKAKARQYAKANEQAIAAYRDIISSLDIECDFHDVPSILYAIDDTKLIEKEYKAAKAAGIDAHLRTDTELPFPITAAVEFPGQAEFHPIKFINSLVKINRFRVYIGTKALKAENNRVITDKGTIHAKKIIIATHYPFINRPGYYFMRMHQERSYVLALENAGTLNSCYLGVDGGKYSFRSYGDKIIMGGCNHRTGENTSGGKFQKLEKMSKKFYPTSTITCRWSAQDCVTGDGIPYIGTFSRKTKDMFVATGFNKWGMTSSMVSAMILSDLIADKKPEFTMFSPQRINHGITLKSFFTNGYKSALGLGTSLFQLPEKKDRQIPDGEGDIIQRGDSKVGYFRDGSGTGHLVSAFCSHLGCQLSWNKDEKTWDCPCHGSQFDSAGSVITGPALKDISKE